MSLTASKDFFIFVTNLISKNFNVDVLTKIKASVVFRMNVKKVRNNTNIYSNNGCMSWRPKVYENHSYLPPHQEQESRKGPLLVIYIVGMSEGIRHAFSNFNIRVAFND